MAFEFELVCVLSQMMNMKCDVVDGLVGSLQRLIMKSLTPFLGSSVGDLGMSLKVRLSLMLRDFESKMVSFMILFLPLTKAS